MKQLIWAQHQARLGIPTQTPPPQHKSAMHGKKRARSDIPIGTWSVYSGVLTIMGITIAAALAMVPTLCDLQVVELWSGMGAIVAVDKKHNYNTATFDLNQMPGVTDTPRERCEDIIVLEGFQKAISFVLCLGEGALLVLGPDSSSFTFPNSGRHKRHLGHEHGDLLYPPVNVGNLMAVIALFLCQLALARWVHFALENPPDSHMFHFLQSVCQIS